VRSLAFIVLVLALLLCTMSSVIETQSVIVSHTRVIVGVKQGFDIRVVVQYLGSYGREMSVIPELNAIVVSVPASLVGHLRSQPFTKYVEEDVIVTALAKPSTGKVYFANYTQNTATVASSTTTISYTVKNNNAKQQVSVIVELISETGELVASNQHVIPARGSVTGSLTFTAPDTPGLYAWSLVLLNALDQSMVYDSEIVYLNVTAQVENPSPTPTPPSSEVPVYNDTVTWNIKYVRAPDIWHNYNRTYGYAALGYHQSIQVAVLDTGIDYSHQELNGNVVWCAKFLNSGSTVYEGYDLSQCMDVYGHGTHVAGIIAARINNMSIAGVAPYVVIYAVKVLSDSGSGYSSDIARGIVEAVKGPDDILGTEDDADVISMSLGGPSSSILYDAVKYAYNNGVVLVAAAGNEGASTPSYPAGYPEVIAVGAIDSNYNVPTWSNRNPDLVAPGVTIYSTLPGNTYGYKSGTSMACPHVSGVVAILQAMRLQAGLGKLTPDQVRQILISTAIDLGVKGYDEQYGYGLVDAYSALNLALNS